MGRAFRQWAALAILAATATAAKAADADLVKRGEYLATSGDCVACHTAPDGKPFAGGLPMHTPFGTIYTPNLTPDKATGIGDWSDDDFYSAMHEGIGKGHQYLYPVFPFPWYTKVTHDDALAIKAYLFSLEPVSAPRKPLQFMFPFNIRTALLAWRTAFFKAASFAPDSSKSDQLNRGAYLVEGLGHCGECHNHRNVLGASDWSGKLQGGEIEGWYAPNITSDGRQGVGSWSEDEIVQFLRTGQAPGRGVVLGPMKQTIDESLSKMTDADLHAIAAYLKSFSPTQTYKPLDANQAQEASAGAGSYLSNCASCHGVDGKGVPGMIPALAGNGAVKAAGPQDVIRVVIAGLPANNGLAPMPASGAALPDAEVAALVNYVRTAWGNDAPPNAGPGDVAKLRGSTATLMSATPDTGCPKPEAAPNLTQAISAAGLSDRLKGVTQNDMVQRIDAILPVVKSAAPSAKDDEIVNAMIEAYCPVALADASVPAPQRTALLGSFGGLVYGRLRGDEPAVRN